MKCHAGAGHGPPAFCGAYGWLCFDCIDALCRFLRRGRL